MANSNKEGISTVEPTEPMTMEQAAESLLSPSDDIQQDDIVDVEEVADDVTDVEEVDENIEPEGDDLGDDDDFAEQDDDDTEEEVAEQPETFAVKVDGEELEVTLEELTRSFSGQKYIQKGMREAADAKKQAEEVFTALQQQQEQLAQFHQTMQQTGVLQPPGEEPAFDPQDPIGYVERLGEYNAKKAAYNQQQAQLNQVAQQQTQAQQQAMQVHLQEQRQILEREIPELADAEKGKQVMTDLRETGQRYGFTESELSSITDARTIKVLHDAMRFQRLQGSKAKVDQKAKKARPVTKPKSPRKVNQAQKDRAEKQKLLRNTGDISAAVDLIFQS